jgi:hypothetical protein
MLYIITAKGTFKNYRPKFNYHRFIAHAANLKELKTYFKASKPNLKIVEIEEKNSDIVEVNI